MPSLPLVQEVYLVGVICAFTAFVLVLAYGRMITYGRDRQAPSARQAQPSSGADRRSTGGTQASR